MMSPAQDAPNGISKTTTNAPSNRRIIGYGGPQLPAMSACRGRPQRCTHMHEHSNVVKFAHLWAATFLDGSAYYPIFILKLKSQPELSRMYLSMNWNIQFLQQTKRNSLFCPTRVPTAHDSISTPTEAYGLYSGRQTEGREHVYGTESPKPFLPYPPRPANQDLYCNNKMLQIE